MRIESDQVAVVTGAGSGIGRSLARAFAARGVRVALADVDEAGMAETVELIGDTAETLIRRCDVSSGVEVEALAEATVATFGRVDVVCNNAGVSGGGPIWDFTEADWTFLLGVNLWGVIHGVRSFVPRFLTQGSGHVVNTASLAGLVAAPGLGSYTTSKHAVVGLSETLYRDLLATGTGVSASVLCPSWVNTRIYDGDRSRPDSLRNPAGASDPATDAAVQEFAAAFFAEAMSPDAVAAMVLDAIDTDRFWILTHPEMTPVVTSRFESMASGENPPARNPFDA